VKKVIAIFLALPLYCNAQSKMNFDDNFTGSYNTTKVGDQTALMINGTNHVAKNNFYADFNPYYNLTYTGQKMTGNELTIKDDIGYNDEKLSVFIPHQYNTSYIRGISSDNLIGLGVGYHFKFKHKTIGVSYAALEEYRKFNYNDGQLSNILRNSFRLKIKLDYTNVAFSFEYYIQPNVNDGTDINIWGSSSIILFNNKPVNFVIQNVYNYMSTDKIKTIQSTSFGIKIKFKNEKTKSI